MVKSCMPSIGGTVDKQYAATGERFRVSRAQMLQELAYLLDKQDRLSPITGM